MKLKIEKPHVRPYNENEITIDDIIELCIEKGLIEKTEYGYYFKREFFESLDRYQ